MTEPPGPNEAALEEQDDCPMEDETARPESEDPENWEDPDQELLNEAMMLEIEHQCLYARRLARENANDYWSVAANADEDSVRSSPRTPPLLEQDPLELPEATPVHEGPGPEICGTQSQTPHCSL